MNFVENAIAFTFSVRCTSVTFHQLVMNNLIFEYNFFPMQHYMRILFIADVTVSA